MDGKIASEIVKLEFLRQSESHYTVEQARAVIKIVFPTKSKRIYEGNSSYELKHLMEHVSSTMMDTAYTLNKYCGNNTIIKAFKMENFRMKEEGLNCYNYLLASEVNRAYSLFRNY